VSDNSEYWRKRAKETLAHAGQLTDPIERAKVLDIVASYQKVADLLREHSSAPEIRAP
jgi:hypothetical protein